MCLPQGLSGVHDRRDLGWAIRDAAGNAIHLRASLAGTAQIRICRRRYVAAVGADERLLGSPRHGAKIAVLHTIRTANGLLRHSFVVLLAIVRGHRDEVAARVPVRVGTEMVLSCPHAFCCDYLRGITPRGE